MYKKISLIGSTGSIGTQCLEVIRNLNLKVVALSSNKNIELLEEQIREFKPKIAVVCDENRAKILSDRVKDLKLEVLSGEGALSKIAELEEIDLFFNAVVGLAGYKPTIAAIKAKKDVAIANKESIVAFGEEIKKLAIENKVKILPVDSEHSAIFQCLHCAKDKSCVKKIILTASGGPFFGKTREQLKSLEFEDVFKHPTWNMGEKITVDSATLMNKGFELIEAVNLFGIAEDKVDVVIHRESIIHSMVEFEDGSIIAQMSLPDMKIPIQYAITYSERKKTFTNELDLAKIAKLSFYKPDLRTFTAIDICRKAISIGGALPRMLVYLNDNLVDLFLKKKITFYNLIYFTETIFEKIKDLPLLEERVIDDLIKELIL